MVLASRTARFLQILVLARHQVGCMDANTAFKEVVGDFSEPKFLPGPNKSELAFGEQPTLQP